MAKNNERKTDAANADIADTRENVGMSVDDYIRMDAKRSQRNQAFVAEFGEKYGRPLGSPISRP
jgi:hypothetical protein